MKMFIAIFFLLVGGNVLAEKYIPGNSINTGVADIYGVEFLEKEHVLTNDSSAVSSSVIKTDLYVLDRQSNSGIRARREALVSSIQLSSTKKIFVAEEIDVYGRVGVYNYQIEKLANRYADQNNPSFHWGKIGKETAPIASIGVEAKPFQHFSFRAEYQRAGSATASSLSVLYKF